MSIELGDAVLRFLGDSTQLELAFDQVAANAEEKLVPATEATAAIGEAMETSGAQAQVASTQISAAWQRVAQATIANTTAQKALQEALAAVKKQGSDDVVAMLALAQAQQNAAHSAQELAIAQKEVGETGQHAFHEARGEVMILNKELGLGVDRHLAGWISKLPGVGTALSAAFNATAVLVLITLLAEGVNKLIEWSQAAEKLREEWIKVESGFREITVNIRKDIDEQEEALVRMREGPVAALDFALRHLDSTSDQVLKSIVSNLEAFAQHLDNRASWTEFGSGFSAAREKIHEFESDLTQVMEKAKDSNPGDPLAGYRAGIDLTSEEMRKLNDELEKAVELNKKIAEGKIQDVPRNEQAIAAQLAGLKKVHDILEQGAEDQAKILQRMFADRREAEVQHEIEIGTAQANAHKATQIAIAQLDLAFDRQQFERGKISFDQLLDSQRSFEQNTYDETKKNLERRQELLSKDPVRNASALIEVNAQLEVLDKTHQQNLFSIEQQAYAQRAHQNERAMQFLIAQTKNGSQERVDLEIQFGELLRQTWGDQSDAYMDQLLRIVEARKAFMEEQKKFNAEEEKLDQALAQDKRSATEKYYQYLLQTFRISVTQLRQLQQNEAEAEFQRRLQALIKQRDQLGPQEILARKQINDQIALLDQQAQEHRAFFIMQTNDEILDSYHQLGIKSNEENQREVALAEDAYEKLRVSGVATYHDILEAKQKLIELKIAAALSAGDQDAMIRLAKDLDVVKKALEDVGLALQKVNILSNNFFDAWHRNAPKTRDVVRNMSLVAKDAINDLAKAEASAIQSWILGQESLGTAMRRATAQILAEYAARAAVEAIYWTAYGFAMLASMQYDRATAAFTAAAELGAFAVVAGAVAAAINPRTPSTGSTGTGSSVTDNNTNQQTQPNPVQKINVQSFARGGLIMGPTMALIGDSINAGSRTRGEIAASLDDPAAMKSIGEAIAPYIKSGGEGPHIHVEVKGMISPDNLGKVVKNISRKVGRGQVNLVSSNSLRVTKRSV